MGKIISWLVPIGILILSFIILFSPLSVEEKETQKSISKRTIFVQNRKDTIAKFGNARFVILRAYDKNPKKEYHILYDNLNYTIENRVDNFTEIGYNVYTLGKNGYTKLNYETGEYTQSKELSDFSEEDQKILENFNPIS